MIRRRKEKFRPILPKALQQSQATQEDEENKVVLDAAKTSETSVAAEKYSCSKNAELQDSENAAVVTEGLTDGQGLSSTKVKVSDNKSTVVECDSESLTAKEDCGEKHIVEETQSEPKEDAALNIKTTPKSDEAVKPGPPKSRRRKFTAIPNTKRTAKAPSTNQVTASGNSGAQKEKEKSETNELSSPSINQEKVITPSQNITDVLVSSVTHTETAGLKSHITSSPNNISTNPGFTSPEPKSLGSLPIDKPQLESGNNSAPAVSPPHSIPLHSPVLHRSPTAGSRHLLSHVKHPQPPNVSRGSRTRHDSTRESTIKDKQNKQRAIGKLKILQQRDPASDSKVWPELDCNFISMSDLIYLNPPRCSGKELGLRAKLREIEEMTATAEAAKELEASAAATESQMQNSEASETPNKPEEDEPALVPQLRVNEDGSVVIDEESLVVNSAAKTVEIVDQSPVYESGLTSKVNYLSFRKRPAVKASRWTDKQTRKFYNALGIVGADFDLMSAMFRHRSRDDLRRKYRLESKRNLAKVDDALRNQHLSKWTDCMFKPESSSEDETKPTPAKQRKKSLKHKRSTSPTPLSLPMVDLPHTQETANLTNAEGHNLLASVIQQCEIIREPTVTCA